MVAGTGLEGLLRDGKDRAAGIEEENFDGQLPVHERLCVSGAGQETHPDTCQGASQSTYPLCVYRTLATVSIDTRTPCW